MPEHPIVDQQEALAVYLRDMFDESPSEITQTAPPIQETQLDADESAHETVAEDWRSQPFQALLMDIHGLQLAIPLQQLCGIREWPDTELPRLPGKPDWYLGLLSADRLHTQVVDPGHIVLPAEMRQRSATPAYMVLIDDGRWAIACHAVSEVITLHPEDIKWRKIAGKRPWLAGTVLEKMCGILDIPALVGLLKT